MTVSTLTSENSYEANGVTTVFPYTFRILAQSDLKILSIDSDGDEAEITSGFTVSGVGADGGGNVTFSDAPEAGLTIVLYRDVPITQPTDYKNQGSFYGSTHERSYDRLTMLAQQLAAAQERSLAFGPGATPPALIPYGDRANKYLAFDADENPIVVEGSGAATDAQLVALSPGVSVRDRLDEIDASDLIGGGGQSRVLFGASALAIVGDSITVGDGASAFDKTYAHMFCRSLMNHANRGMGEMRGAGYHATINMGTLLDDPDFTTTGAVVVGGTVYSRLHLDDGEVLSITNRQIRFLGFIYSAPDSSGDIQILRNGVVINTTAVVAGASLQLFIPISVANGQLSPVTDIFQIKASGGSLRITCVQLFTTLENCLLCYDVSAGGTGIQDFDSVGAASEVAYYLNAYRGGTPRTLIIALGHNNIYSDLRAITPIEYVDRLADYIALMQAAVSNLTVVLQVPTKASDVDEPYLTAYTYEDYRDAIVAYAQDSGLPLLRFDRSVLSRFSGYYADARHPNDLGHSIMARALCDMMGIVFDPSQNRFGQTTDLPTMVNFVPVALGETAAGVGTYSFATGRTYRMGNVAFVALSIGWTAHTGTGNLRINGLPFRASNLSGFLLQGLNVSYNGFAAGAGKQVSARMINGETALNLIANDPNNLGFAVIAMDSAVNRLDITGWYFID